VKGPRGYSLKVKRESSRPRSLVARATLPAGILLALAASGCRGREESASPADAPLDHSQKSSSSVSLPFAPLSFDEAIVRARAEKKLVLVDMTADWCTWCTKMDEDVFTNARVQAALLGYIPIKVNADKGGGRSVASRYHVEGLPTFLLVDGDGELVGRFEGYLPVDAFLVKLGRSSGVRG
jgi:thiol:disulfide interchange protein